MTDILVFGGTTEGRKIAEFCNENEIEIYVSITSKYGDELLPESKWIHTIVGRMDEISMCEFIKNHNISTVIDATHPYAKEVTANIKKAARNINLYRVVREKLTQISQDDSEMTLEDKIIYLDDINQVVEYLMDTEGKVFVTTGSKELGAFTRINGFDERLIVRVLDSESVVNACKDMGFSDSNIIAKRGPFSYEENIKHFTNARYLVTKCSGKTGGYDDKIKAAIDMDMKVLAIKPIYEEGYTIDEMKNILIKMR